MAPTADGVSPSAGSGAKQTFQLTYSDGNGAGDLATMKVLQSFDVTEGPDVLAFDEGLQRLYVGCEGGAVDVFHADVGGLTAIGKFSAPNAHTVSVDQKTHRVFVALKNAGGKPSLWILAPTAK